ncbi:ribosome-binding protein 1-like isoform X2 [Denticeps clupeoides]|uniref:ribosome-binding protein 1-like isoform X2 n=1 Tax=Denticeps clupeoides TaxID=299321 RepID=UPI0010A2BAA5|nr:ribosome-binding protein 1-like isoform X2 [Denticeps clupeoides]
MDIYDPQTLGIMVFGGFMVISAIGIALVSTFTMKETSYEEALAKQRQELGKPQAPRSEKKKKDKAAEKRKGKKKDEKVNGKLPEVESIPENVEAVASPDTKPAVPPAAVAPAVPAPIPAPTPAPVNSPSPVSVSAVSVAAPVAAAAALPVTSAPRVTPVEIPPAPSPKDKKKKEKKVAKVDPAPTLAPAPIPKPAAKPEPVVKEVPVMAVPPVGTQRSDPKSAPVEAPPAKGEEPKPEAPSKKKGGSKKKSEPAVAADPADTPLYLPYKALVSTMKSMVFSEGEAQQLIEILSEKSGVRQDTWRTAAQKGDLVVSLKKQLEDKEKQIAVEQKDTISAKNRLRDMAKELSAEKSKVAQVETRLSSQLSAREQEMIALQARMQASYQDHMAETHKYKAKIQSLQDQLDKGPSAQMARLQQENSILRDALNKATSLNESKQNAELAKLRQECAKLNKELSEKAGALQADEQTKKSMEAKVAAAEAQLSQLQAGRAASEQALQKRLEEVSEELRKSQTSGKSLQAELERVQQESNALAELKTQVANAETQRKERCTQVEVLHAHVTQLEVEKKQMEDKVASVHMLLEASQIQKEAINVAEVEHLRSSLKESEIQIASLEEQLKHLTEMRQEPISSAVSDTTEAEKPPSESVEQRMLEEELKMLKEEMEAVKSARTAEICAEVEQLQVCLKERETLLTSLESELQKTREEKSVSAAQLHQLHNSLSEKKQQLALQGVELKEAHQGAELRSEHTAELAHLQSRLTEKETAVTSLQHELELSKSANEAQLRAFQTETKEVLRAIFPHMVIDTEQIHWLQDFAQKAQETLSQSQQRQESQHCSELPELMKRLRQSEESHGSLQAECEQYRLVLAETESMLKHLQKSVEEEEQVWKSKIAESEGQLKKAQEQVHSLEQTVDGLRKENQSAEQLKEQVILLEAQLEKQVESATSENQSYSAETIQLKQLLVESQTLLDVTQKEARAQREELSVVRQQLSEMTEHAQKREQQNGQPESEASQVQAQLNVAMEKLYDEETFKQELLEDFEQSQKLVVELQAQLSLLKSAEEATVTDTEDLNEMKGRLEKEKKLSKDLGLAATKLQQLLRVSQEQLSKERDTVRNLRDQLQGKVETDEVKEGTSV